MNLSQFRYEALAASVAGIILMAYLVLRAVLVPFAHDEAATFFHYVHTGDFIPGFALGDANNHFLNSLLSWISYELFGSTKLALRLPNLLSFPVFLYFCFRFSRDLKLPVWGLALFITLAFSHNFIEFFALSRGYGMSMAFMMASLYQAYRYYENRRNTSLISSLLWITAACLANLTLCIPALILTGALGLHILVNRTQPGINLRSTVTAWVVLGILSLVACVALLFIMQQKGLLYYGSDAGLWKHTLPSLTLLLFNTDAWLVRILLFAALIPIAISCVYFDDEWHWPSKLSSRNLFQCIFLCSLLFLLAAGEIFGIQYPEDRTGLYLYPFFLLALFFSLKSFSAQSQRQVYRLPAMLILIGSIVHFALHANLTHSRLWGSITIPESFVEKISGATGNESHRATVGTYQLNLLCYQYANFRLGGKLNQAQVSDFPGRLADFQIGRPDENPQWNRDYSIIGADPLSGHCLWKRNRSLARSFVLKQEVEKSGITHENDVVLFEGRIDSLKGKALMVEYDLRIESPERPFRGRILCKVLDDRKRWLRFEIITLDWMKTSLSFDEPLRYSMYIPSLPENSQTLLILLENRHKEGFRMGGGDIGLYTLRMD